MNNLHLIVGLTVRLNDTIYLVESLSMGLLVLVPIKRDDSRKPIPVTSEIRNAVKKY